MTYTVIENGKTVVSNNVTNCVYVGVLSQNTSWMS